MRNETSDYSMKITGSGVCDIMQYIDPKVYIDMNNGVIMKMYNNLEEMETFKGFHIFAIDGSIVDGRISQGDRTISRTYTTH